MGNFCPELLGQVFKPASGVCRAPDSGRVLLGHLGDMFDAAGDLGARRFKRRCCCVDGNEARRSGRRQRQGHLKRRADTQQRGLQGGREAGCLRGERVAAGRQQGERKATGGIGFRGVGARYLDADWRRSGGGD